MWHLRVNIVSRDMTRNTIRTNSFHAMVPVRCVCDKTTVHVPLFLLAGFTQFRMRECFLALWIVMIIQLACCCKSWLLSFRCDNLAATRRVLKKPTKTTQSRSDRVLLWCDRVLQVSIDFLIRNARRQKKPLLSSQFKKKHALMMRIVLELWETWPKARFVFVARIRLLW